MGFVPILFFYPMDRHKDTRNRSSFQQDLSIQIRNFHRDLKEAVE